MELRLNLLTTPFNLDHTLNCGQVFRWEKRKGWWHGIIRENIVKIQQLEDRLIYHAHPDMLGEIFIKSYFGLDDDLPSILTSINKDFSIGRAIRRFYGLRIIRQDPWECMISYICATNSSISMIKRMVLNLARRFGRRVVSEGKEFYTFPDPGSLAEATVNEMQACSLGYRSNYILSSARAVARGEVSLEGLASYDYRTAREVLLASPSGRKLLPGVGPKVADCILLFSLGKMEAFPIDVWIKRAIIRFYPHLFEGPFISSMRKRVRRGGSISLSEYEKIAGTLRDYFGRHAGYAQEYLYAFFRARTEKVRFPQIRGPKRSDTDVH